MMLNRFAAILTIAIAAMSGAAVAAGDGKTLFGYYRCNSCHGDNGQGSTAAPDAKAIAGMEGLAVIESIDRLIAAGRHEDYFDAGCGETPSRSQIQAIADYVARLPK
jgi:mono/diheme cytochrome c family protein